MKVRKLRTPIFRRMRFPGTWLVLLIRSREDDQESKNVQENIWNEVHAGHDAEAGAHGEFLKTMNSLSGAAGGLMYQVCPHSRRARSTNIESIDEGYHVEEREEWKDTNVHPTPACFVNNVIEDGDKYHTLSSVRTQ